MTEITPCRGQGAVYDAALDPRASRARRTKAQLTASSLCARCPIAATCDDRVTPPSSRALRKAHMSITDITPHSTPVAPAPPREQAAPQPPTPSAAEPAGIPTDPDGLILWGAAHQSSRMQTLAGKARGALTDLRQAAERETKVAEAEARVARLKAQLENAQHDLASAKGAPKTKGTTAPAEDYAAIRAWAREQGIEVGRVGRPKREVVDAYHAAQQPQQLATAS